MNAEATVIVVGVGLAVAAMFAVYYFAGRTEDTP